MNFISGSRIQSAGQWLALAGAYLFAAMAWLEEDVASAGLYLLSLGVLLQAPAFLRAMSREPMFWLFLAALVYLTLQAWATIPYNAHSASDQWDQYRDWVRLWGFLPLAWVVRGNHRHVLALLGLAVGGFVIGRLLHVDPAFLATIWAGGRSGFGLEPNGAGQYAAAIVVGLILLSGRLHGRSRSLWRYALWLLVLLVSLQIILSTSARGVWLSVLLILPVAWLIARRLRRQTAGESAGLARSALAAALVLALVALNYSNIAEDTRIETYSYETFLLLGQAPIVGPTGAISARVHLILFGLERWQERPWFGWGPDVGKYFLRDEVSFLRREPHLHNGFVSVLVQFGLVGLLFPVSVLVLLLRHAVIRPVDNSSDIRLALGAGLAIASFSWGYDVMVRMEEWRYFWILLAGLFYSWQFVASGRTLTCARAEPDSKASSLL